MTWTARHYCLGVAALELFGLPFRWQSGDIAGVLHNGATAVVALYLAKLAKAPS